jgi:peptidoglycan hydrolase-like protein with peptidoglycan-binding domain
MELAAYLHSELTQTQLEQGIDVAPPLDCGVISAIARSTSSSKVGLCVTFAAFSLIANLSSASGVLAGPQNSSSDMRYIQTLLANNGFDPGPIDGVKGAATKAAIVRAQKAFGLEADGVAGSQTLAALESRSAPAKTSISLNTATTSAGSDSQASVMNLQKLLTDRGFFNGPITGNYGSMTRNAVIAAQKAYGLTPDGIAGAQTMAALETDSAAVVPISSSDVLTLQRLLSDRGFYAGAIDGIMGAQTKAAVIAAQKAYGLTPDGIAGAQTMAALQGGKPGQTTSATTSDTNVIELQKLLASRGFYTGAIDGIMGAQTKAAIIAAQKSYRLTPDGIAGAQTMAALKQGSATNTATAKPATPATTPIAANSKTGASTTTSDGIANLQNLLKDRGFYDGPISGILGPRTRSAIILAQKAYGLVADGIAGSATIAALESRAPVAKPTTPQPISVAPTTPQPAIQPVPQPTPATTPAPVATPKPTPAPVATTQPAPTAPFTRSNSVAEIQQLLAQRGFYTGAADGVLSNETKNAILRAQNFYALTPADGNPSAALVDSLKKDPFVVGGN